MVKRHTKTRKGNIKTQKKTRVLRGGTISWDEKSGKFIAKKRTDSNLAQATFWNNLANYLGVGNNTNDLLTYVNQLRDKGWATGARFSPTGKVIPSSLGTVATLRTVVSYAIDEIGDRAGSEAAVLASLQALLTALQTQVTERIKMKTARELKGLSEDGGHFGYRKAVTELRDKVDGKIKAILTRRAKAAANRKALKNNGTFPAMGMTLKKKSAQGTEKQLYESGSGGSGAWGTSSSYAAAIDGSERTGRTQASSVDEKGSGGSARGPMLVLGRRPQQRQRQQQSQPMLTLGQGLGGEKVTAPRGPPPPPPAPRGRHARDNPNSFWDESYGMHYTNNNRKPPPPGYEGGKRKTRRRKHKKKRTIKKRHKKRKRTKRRRKH